MYEIWLDGEFHSATKPTLLASNNSFRGGDCLFETMRVSNGSLPLKNLHFDRLLSGMKMLSYHVPKSFSRKFLEDRILELVDRNKQSELARVRLTVFRKESINKKTGPGLLIETFQIEPEHNSFNKNGLSIDAFSHTRKYADGFANLKSTNNLIYSLAAKHARENNLDDCLILNHHGRVADASIFNVFLVRKNMLITPALTEGGVAGVMRRYLLASMKKSYPKLELREGVVTLSDLEVFDEVFLTNAIRGIRWVGSYRGKKYSNTFSRRVYDELITPLFFG